MNNPYNECPVNKVRKEEEKSNPLSGVASSTLSRALGQFSRPSEVNQKLNSFHFFCLYFKFFGNAGVLYWDLTLPMFVLQLHNMMYDTPYGQVGFGGNEGNPSLLVRDDQRMTLYGKALGVGC